jgi:hypothetical protein
MDQIPRDLPALSSAGSDPAQFHEAFSFYMDLVLFVWFFSNLMFVTCEKM